MVGLPGRLTLGLNAIIHRYLPALFVDYNLHSMNRMVALLALCGTAAYAQSAGTITGTVVDSDGEAVANAQVQATNRSTKAVYKIAGSEMGHYTLATLPPDAYDVSVTAPGFNANSQTDVIPRARLIPHDSSQRFRLAALYRRTCRAQAAQDKSSGPRAGLSSFILHS
jgi:hypothetical protein